MTMRIKFLKNELIKKDIMIDRNLIEMDKETFEDCLNNNCKCLQMNKKMNLNLEI